MTNRYFTPASAFAAKFFVVSIAAFLAAGLLAYLLAELFAPLPHPGAIVVPPAFWVSTALLFAASVALQHSLGTVRLERQRAFRRSLVFAVVAGTLFVGVQGYGLNCLLKNQLPDQAQTGVNAFIFMFAAVHGLHVTVALLFAVWVMLKGFSDRYDHEYYWGAVVCTFFWHILGIVWLAIFAALLIAS